MFKDLIDKNLIERILAVISVYGPLSEDEIIFEIEECFSYSCTKEDFINMKDYLVGLVGVGRIYLIKDKYSSLRSDVIDIAEKEFESIIFGLSEKKKEYPKEELIKYANVDKLYGIKEFDDLKKYYDSLIFKSNTNKEELFLAACFGLYSCFDIEKVKDEICSKTKNFNRTRFDELLEEYDSILPRPFLNGYTFKDINNMEDEIKRNVLKKVAEENGDNSFEETFTDKYKVKTKLDKKPYGAFTYEECMELTKKVAKTEIFKLIDSDKVLEFYVNDKPVYVEILGYYGKEKAIMIFKSKIDMINTHRIMYAEEEEPYLDMPMHVACIEVNADNTDFLDETMISELKSKNIPLMPNFTIMERCKKIRLPDQEEINLIGAVLSDIIKLVQTSNLSDIKLNLGDNDEMYDIYQVYVDDNEVSYGKYNDIDFEDIYLDFDLDPLDEDLVRTIKRYANHDIYIGTYISYYNVEEIDEFPHMVYIYDKKSRQIIDCLLKTKQEMKTIKNDVLKKLFDKKMNPRNIYVNNDYCYEIFDEYDDYFNLDFDEDGILDSIYVEFRDGVMKQFDNSDGKVYKA